MTLSGGIHIALHFLLPLLIALCFARSNWRSVAVVMMATMLVDLDHLLATPIYDPNRCSIGTHPLHMWPAIAVYAVLPIFRRTRWIGVGLLLHMALDFTDCYL